VTFPESGLFMGVAERYEVACDFSGYEGRTLFLWNDKVRVPMLGGKTTPE
jgi:hypothetical protein